MKSDVKTYTSHTSLNNKNNNKQEQEQKSKAERDLEAIQAYVRAWFFYFFDHWQEITEKIVPILIVACVALGYAIYYLAKSSNIDRDTIIITFMVIAAVIGLCLWVFFHIENFYVTEDADGLTSTSTENNSTENKYDHKSLDEFDEGSDDDDGDDDSSTQDITIVESKQKSIPSSIKQGLRSSDIYILAIVFLQAAALLSTILAGRMLKTQYVFILVAGENVVFGFIFAFYTYSYNVTNINIDGTNINTNATATATAATAAPTTSTSTSASTSTSTALPSSPTSTSTTNKPSILSRDTRLWLLISLCSISYLWIGFAFWKDFTTNLTDWAAIVTVTVLCATAMTIAIMSQNVIVNETTTFVILTTLLMWEALLNNSSSSGGSSGVSDMSPSVILLFLLVLNNIFYKYIENSFTLFLLVAAYQIVAFSFRWTIVLWRTEVVWVGGSASVIYLAYLAFVWTYVEGVNPPWLLLAAIGLGFNHNLIFNNKYHDAAAAKSSKTSEQLWYYLWPGVLTLLMLVAYMASRKRILAKDYFGYFNYFLIFAIWFSWSNMNFQNHDSWVQVPSYVPKIFLAYTFFASCVVEYFLFWAAVPSNTGSVSNANTGSVSDSDAGSNEKKVVVVNNDNNDKNSNSANVTTDKKPPAKFFSYIYNTWVWFMISTIVYPSDFILSSGVAIGMDDFQYQTYFIYAHAILLIMWEMINHIPKAKTAQEQHVLICMDKLHFFYHLALLIVAISPIHNQMTHISWIPSKLTAYECRYDVFIAIMYVFIAGVVIRLLLGFKSQIGVLEISETAGTAGTSGITSETTGTTGTTSRSAYSKRASTDTTAKRLSTPSISTSVSTSTTSANTLTPFEYKTMEFLTKTSRLLSHTPTIVAPLVVIATLLFKLYFHESAMSKGNYLIFTSVFIASGLLICLVQRIIITFINPKHGILLYSISEAQFLSNKEQIRVLDMMILLWVFVFSFFYTKSADLWVGRTIYILATFYIFVTTYITLQIRKNQRQLLHKERAKEHTESSALLSEGEIPGDTSFEQAYVPYAIEQQTQQTQKSPELQRQQQTILDTLLNSHNIDHLYNFLFAPGFLLILVYAFGVGNELSVMPEKAGNVIALLVISIVSWLSAVALYYVMTVDIAGDISSGISSGNSGDNSSDNSDDPLKSYTATASDTENDDERDKRDERHEHVLQSQIQNKWLYIEAELGLLPVLWFLHTYVQGMLTFIFLCLWGLRQLYLYLRNPKENLSHGVFAILFTIFLYLSLLQVNFIHHDQFEIALLTVSVLSAFVAIILFSLRQWDEWQVSSSGETNHSDNIESTDTSAVTAVTNDSSTGLQPLQPLLIENWFFFCATCLSIPTTNISHGIWSTLMMSVLAVHSYYNRNIHTLIISPILILVSICYILRYLYTNNTDLWYLSYVFTVLLFVTWLSDIRESPKHPALNRLVSFLGLSTLARVFSIFIMGLTVLLTVETLGTHLHTSNHYTITLTFSIVTLCLAFVQMIIYVGLERREAKEIRRKRQEQKRQKQKQEQQKQEEQQEEQERHHRNQQRHQRQESQRHQQQESQSHQQQESHSQSQPRPQPQPQSQPQQQKQKETDFDSTLFSLTISIFFLFLLGICLISLQDYNHNVNNGETNAKRLFSWLCLGVAFCFLITSAFVVRFNFKKYNQYQALVFVSVAIAVSFLTIPNKTERIILLLISSIVTAVTVIVQCVMNIQTDKRERENARRKQGKQGEIQV